MLITARKPQATTVELKSDNMAGIVGEYTGIFATIGVLSFSYIALRALYTFWRVIKSYVIGSDIDVKSLGEWAGMALQDGNAGSNYPDLSSHGQLVTARNL